MGDKRQDLVPGFVAWIDVSGNLLLEGLVEAFGEAVRGGRPHGTSGPNQIRVGQGNHAEKLPCACYPVLWVSTFDSLTVIGIRGLRCVKVSFKEASSSRKRIRDRIRALLVLRTRKRFKTREGDSCSRRDSMKQNYISIAIGVTECGLGRYRLDTDY